MVLLTQANLGMMPMIGVDQCVVQQQSKNLLSQAYYVLTLLLLAR